MRGWRYQHHWLFHKQCDYKKFLKILESNRTKLLQTTLNLCNDVFVVAIIKYSIC